MGQDPQEYDERQEKMVEILISRRMLVDDKYALPQDRLERNLFTIWGSTSASASEGTHYNDKLRLFGLIMTREDNRSEFERLA